MPQYSFPELDGLVPSSIPSFLKQYVDAARDAACGFYLANPANAIGREFNNPLTAVSDALYRQVCPVPTRPSIPNPSAPVPGGQCQGVRYVVTATLTAGGETLDPSVTRGLGPVGGVVREVTPDGNSTLFGIKFADGTRQILNTTNNNNPTAVITNIVREDGGADTCGNGSPLLPGGDGVPLPVLDRPPISLPSAPGGPLIPFVPRIIPIFPIAPGIYFQPEINVNLGPFNFNFDLGGLTVSAPININLPPQSSPPALPPVNPPTVRAPSTDCPDCCDDVKAIKKRVDKIIIDGDVVESLYATYSVQDGFSVELPNKPSRTELVITSFPTTKRSQSGSGVNDVLWAGWIWWGYGAGRVGRRDPIDAQTKVYRFPPDWRWGGLNAKQFRGTLYQGFKATLNVYQYTKV